MSPAKVLIAGASGVVGRAALELLAPRMPTLGLSRRPPDTGAGHHLQADLDDPTSLAAALAGESGITHLVYSALFEKPGLFEGWLDPEQMQRNERMLSNCLDALRDHPLQHVSLLQGTKAYGAHVRPMAVPGREREPRVEHPNFYWLQEDLLRARAAQASFAFTIWRPPLIVGHALGAPMNVLAPLGIYAAICRATGEPFGYPGGVVGPIDAVDARLLAGALAWAMDAPTARDRTFNITNGDLFLWDQMWPHLADAFGLPRANPTPRSLAKWLPERSDLWDEIRARHGLRAPALQEFTGDSLLYIDMFMNHGGSSAPPPTFLSSIALRQAGFTDCIDSADMFAEWITVLERARLLPSH